MKQLLGLTFAATAAFAVSAMAAPEHVRVRGTVASIGGDTLTVHTATGEDVPVMLGSDTHYLKVLKSNLEAITPGSFIGTATKNVGSKLVALEVVVFPPEMKGAGEGHYDWDKLPDTTKTAAAGGGMAASTMTNGSVAAVGSPGSGVSSTMTNGTVATAAAAHGTKRLRVTYKGGEQTILVPETAPIVTFTPGAMSDVTQGATVFVNGTKDQGKITAGAVAVGTEGVTPPM